MQIGCHVSVHISHLFIYKELENLVLYSTHNFIACDHYTT